MISEASAFPPSELVGNIAQLGEPDTVVLRHMAQESLYHVQPVVPPDDLGALVRL